MTTDSRRKEGKPEAEMEDSGESPVPLPKSAMVDEAERDKSILPSDEQHSHIATIEGVVSDWNIEAALAQQRSPWNRWCMHRWNSCSHEKAMAKN
jgi:hypothetical protein